MIPLLDIGIQLGQMFLGKLQNQAPTHVLSAVQAAIDALMAHRDDLVTKANLEAQRG
jgi:hypothetical protein